MRSHPHLTRLDRRPRRAAMAAATAALALVALGAAPAHGHVEPTVTEVPAGSDATLTFVVEHGCGESPTVRVDIKVPENVTDPEPQAKDGWNASVADGAVTFEWAGIDGQEDGTFEVDFTAPDAAGSTLLFPTIQTCAEGSYDWIQEDPDGDRPAPRILVIGAEAGEPSATTEAERGEVDTTELGEAPADPDSDAETTSDDAAADDDEDDGGSNAALIGLGAVVAVALVGGGVVLAKRRSGQGS